MSDDAQQEETAPFVPLTITEMSTTFSGKPGDVVNFFVKLNRENVQVQYQWQRLYTGKSYDGDGVLRQYECRYIDEAHVEVGNELYHICQFAEIMERNGSTYAPVSPFIKSLPMLCYNLNPSTNEVVFIINGHGNYITSPASSADKSKNIQFVDEKNAELRVTKAQAAAMLHGCLHGWQTPGADPARYDENGQPQKKKSREAER